MKPELTKTITVNGQKVSDKHTNLKNFTREELLEELLGDLEQYKINTYSSLTLNKKAVLEISKKLGLIEGYEKRKLSGQYMVNYPKYEEQHPAKNKSAYQDDIAKLCGTSSRHKFPKDDLFLIIHFLQNSQTEVLPQVEKQVYHLKSLTGEPVCGGSVQPPSILDITREYEARKIGLELCEECRYEGDTE